mgnify:CR=1 FL=1
MIGLSHTWRVRTTLPAAVVRVGSAVLADTGSVPARAAADASDADANVLVHLDSAGNSQVLPSIEV